MAISFASNMLCCHVSAQLLHVKSNGSCCCVTGENSPALLRPCPCQLHVLLMHLLANTCCTSAIPSPQWSQLICAGLAAFSCSRASAAQMHMVYAQNTGLRVFLQAFNPSNDASASFTLTISMDANNKTLSAGEQESLTDIYNR